MANEPSYQPTLTSWDDYPVHQVAETIRHAATSDRNFYDRYYFNCHGSADDLFLITGVGQYPNLGTQDAFVVVRRGDDHRVVRASRPLTDRMDTSVGPFHVEVLEPLHKLRVTLDDNEHGLAYDLTWEGAIPAFEEPRQYIRKHGRVLFDTMRLAQTGTWTGTIDVAGETIEVTPDRWKGTRDRSWGVRPVGEPEPAGIREGEGQMSGMWNYAPMQFDDFSILYICQETDQGDRPLEEAVRIWADPDRQPEWLGRPEHDHHLIPGTRVIDTGHLSFPEAEGGPIEVAITSLLPCAVAIGTGYGLDADWRHGMFQGPELVVQGLHLRYSDAEERDRLEQPWGIIDHVARFELTQGGDTVVGHGLHEHGFFGPYTRYGLEGYDGMAPEDMTSTMKLDTQLRAPLGAVADEARALADAGFDGAFTFEGPHDVFFPLLEAADAPLDLYTNLAIAFPRSPTHLAHASWDLAERTGGRFGLGLGTQVRAHIERRYGVPWDKPVSRMRELIEATRAIWSTWQDGGELAYEGEHYQLSLMPPTFRPKPLPSGSPSILVGAVGPDMTRMVAKAADGLLVHPFQTPTFMGDVLLPRMEQGLAEADRSRDDFTLVCESIVAVWRSEDELGAAMDAARGLVAFYGSTPAYRAVLDAEGMGELQPQLRDLTREGRWAELGSIVPDELVRTIAVCGEPDEVGEGLAARYGGVADRLGFYSPGQDLSTEVLSAILAAARA